MFRNAAYQRLHILYYQGELAETEQYVLECFFTLLKSNSIHTAIEMHSILLYAFTVIATLLPLTRRSQLERMLLRHSISSTCPLRS